ncbi:hypothetical protein F4824DRAFT_472631, partial [Ustulina deusta]
MRKELKTSQTPSLTKYYPPLYHNHARLTDHSKAERRNISGGRDAERFVNIPVVFPIFGAKLSHNTVQVNVSLNSLPSYGELIAKILSAGESILWSLFEEDDDFAAAMRQAKTYWSVPGRVYFVWDFAPQIHFTETGCTLPSYGISEASYMSAEEFGEYLHAAYAGRISYILVATELTRGKITETGLEEPKQSQQEKKKAKGPDGKPPGGALLEEGSGSTTPQQQPLPKQASQTASSQGDAVKIGQQESAETGNTIHPGPHRYINFQGSKIAEEHERLGGVIAALIVMLWLLYPLARIINAFFL